MGPKKPVKPTTAPKKRLVVKTKKPANKKAKEALEVQSDPEESDESQSPRRESPRDPTPPPSQEAAETSKAKSRKPRTVAANLLSEDNEVALAEWLRDNECIFRKTLKKFHDAQHKNGLWTDKAKEFNLESGHLLKTIYDSIRTRIGKLHKLKSGSETKELSARDVFLWSNFGFLADHITRVIKGRTAVSVSIKKYWLLEVRL